MHGIRLGERQEWLLTNIHIKKKYVVIVFIRHDTTVGGSSFVDPAALFPAFVLHSLSVFLSLSVFQGLHACAHTYITYIVPHLAWLCLVNVYY